MEAEEMRERLRAKEKELEELDDGYEDADENRNGTENADETV